MLLKIRLKFSNEDVWGFVSGLQLGNLGEWDCPRGEAGRTLASAVHLKQRVCVLRRGGELESSRPGGAGGGKAAGTSVHRLCRQHQHALLSLLGTKRNSGCLSPCLGWSSNSRRPVAFSPPLLRATDPSLTDREGNVQMVWVSAASGSHCRALYPHRLTTQRTCFF